jgi:hypothetical protein
MWHVGCACFNGLWGRRGLPLTGRQRRARAFTRHPAADWRALYTPHIGEGARWRGGEAPLPQPPWGSPNQSAPSPLPVPDSGPSPLPWAQRGRSAMALLIFKKEEEKELASL